MRKLIFDPLFEEHLAYWRTANPKVAAKLVRIIQETGQSPFEGIGKPEPLRENWSGYWSRRLTQEHRVVYEVIEKAVIFIRAYGHY